jgi:hypothetical protein
VTAARVVAPVTINDPAAAALVTVNELRVEAPVTPSVELRVVTPDTVNVPRTPVLPVNPATVNFGVPRGPKETSLTTPNVPATAVLPVNPATVNFGVTRGPKETSLTTASVELRVVILDTASVLKRVVAPVTPSVELAFRVVNAPAALVVPPIGALSIVPPEIVAVFITGLVKVLLVSVSAPARVAKSACWSAVLNSARVPVNVLLARLNDLFVNVSVVAFPTRVSVAAGRVRVPEAAAVGCKVVVPEVAPDITALLMFMFLEASLTTIADAVLT